MFQSGFDAVEFEDAWVEGDEGARWRVAVVLGPATGAAASGSSLLELDPGCHLPMHTDSAEEVVVVVSGRARLTIDGRSEALAEGGVAVIPADAPHEVVNLGFGPLRFAAVYADTEVVTRYEREVQPGGGTTRRPIAA